MRESQQGGDNTANKRIEIRIDNETFFRIMAKHPDLKVTKYLKDQLLRLEQETPEHIQDSPIFIPEVKDKKAEPKPVGTPVKCPRCKYAWNYTGMAWRIKCHRCGAHLKTHVKRY